ncbi:MAG: PorT family protein [Muribaculaceae bacterium]|nr:PorT family protein [Muribaculaceae bacterium]
MMKCIRLLLIAIFANISFILDAKVNVGIEVLPQLSSRFSWSAGVNLEIPIANRLYLSPGAFYSSRHRHDESSWEISEYTPAGDEQISYEKASINIHGDYLHIPFLIGYKGYTRHGHTIKIAGGIYYAYLLGGKSKIKMDDNGNFSEMVVPSFVTAIDYKSDYGLCVEAKCLLYGNYQIGLNVQHGLRKIYQGFNMPGIRDPYISHRLGPGVRFHQSIGLSLGYMF